MHSADIRVKGNITFCEYSLKPLRAQWFTGIFVAGMLVLPSMPTFADNLKRLRDECKLTQVELARRAGLTQSAISRYETGEDIPEVSSLLKLATGLRLPLDPLVEGLDVKFDAVYRDLRISITSEETGEEYGTETAELPPDVLPGAPDPIGGAHEPDSQEMAAAIPALHRVVAELVSVVARLPHGPVAVARDLGSDVRPRAARPRPRTRPRTPSKAASKRR